MSILNSYTSRKRFADRVRRFFGGAPRYVQVAALPWRRTEAGGVEVMLITSRGTGRWVIPKGWPEGDEPLNTAAAREAIEEAGISGRIDRQDAGSYLYGKRLRSGPDRQCEVRVFPLEVDKVAEDWPERHQRTRRWYKPEEAAGLVAERDLAELISTFQP